MSVLVSECVSVRVLEYAKVHLSECKSERVYE